MYRNSYLSGVSAAHKYLFFIGCYGNVSCRLQGQGETPVRG